MGAVYVLLILDVIVNITYDMVKGLREHIKLFDQKGLQGMYPMMENVGWMMIDYTNICDTLYQQKISPDDYIYNIIQGLSLASHGKFLKMCVDYAVELENPLMQSVILTGSVLKQISTVLETALSIYTLYSLSMGRDA